MIGDRVRIYNSLTPPWDGETGRISAMREAWINDQTYTVARVSLDNIALQAEFFLSELSQL